MADPVRFELDDRGVATITLARPDRLNAISMAMRDLLWQYLEACRDIPDCRVILFRGEGRAFSAGADITEFGTAENIMDSRRARHDRDVWWEMLNHRCVTIAAMHGFCFGAGLELPLCCDVRIARDDTTFALPEVTLGYIPSACATQTLPRTIPPGAAAHMILTGEPIDATAAARWGLASVHTADAWPAAVDAAVEQALRSPDEMRERRLRMVGGLPAL